MDFDVLGGDGFFVRFRQATVLLPDGDAPDVDGVTLEAVGRRHHEVLVDLE